MKVARLLVYEGDEVSITKWMGRNHPDGIREGACASMRVVTLPNRWWLWHLVKTLWGKSST